MSEKNNLAKFAGEDPEMQIAIEKARESLRFFWRELDWAFSDPNSKLFAAYLKIQLKGPNTEIIDGDLNEEKDLLEDYMWLTGCHFDGRNITGLLMHDPSERHGLYGSGVEVSVPVIQLYDWLYVIGKKVYGGFTVNVSRSRQSTAERKVHDKKWGFSFPPLNKVRIAPNREGLSKGAKSKTQSDFFYDHIQENIPEDYRSKSWMKETLVELKGDPEFLNGQSETGCTLLHGQALAGNALTVEFLMKKGADATITNNYGDTPRDLAKIMGWDNVIKVLDKYE
ncbi:MAG: DUF2314 domain-containing protein [Planctomycetaceae bacterium]